MAVRQIYYWLISLGVIAKTEAEYSAAVFRPLVETLAFMIAGMEVTE
jgi:hypothetical protein